MSISVLVLTLAKNVCSQSKPKCYSLTCQRFLRGIPRSERKVKVLPSESKDEENGNDSLAKKSKLEVKSQRFLPFRIAVPEIINAENQHECLSMTMTPFWNMPYHEQLNLKQKWAVHVLSVFRRTIEKEGLKNPFSIRNVLTQVVASPVTEKYRNKDELCVRSGVDGNPKTVGFIIGSMSKGVVCVRGDKLVNMKDSHKVVARLFEKYINTSPLRACHHFKDGGHWRNIIVRSNHHGDLMAIVVIHPQSLAREDIVEEARLIREFFSEGEGKDCGLTSLYFQSCPHTRCTNDQAPFELLFGKPFLEEVCLNYGFRLSPDSFFQVNSLAAELLYGTVLDLAAPNAMTTLLDICCGAGALAVLASSRVRGVVGIESVYSAVRDARANVITNGCSNVEIIPGLAEKKLPRVIEELDSAPDIVAVINPGRGGVGHQVIQAIRECNRIERVVYVSCDAEGAAMKNFVQLCAPSEHKKKLSTRGGGSAPFSLTRAVPIDIFPHTAHCEMVLLFERKL